MAIHLQSCTIPYPKSEQIMAVMFCNNISLQIREQKGNKWPLLSILLSNNSGRLGLGDSRWNKIKERMKLKALIFALEYFTSPMAYFCNSIMCLMSLKLKKSCFLIAFPNPISLHGSSRDLLNDKIDPWVCCVLIWLVPGIK